MLLKAPDDKQARLAELDRLAKVAPPARKWQIAEESRILYDRYLVPARG